MSYFVDDDGVKYNCCEQYMMAQKALVFKDESMYKTIMQEQNPAKIKKLGSLVRNFVERVWSQHKYEIICKGNYYKFSQNEALQRILLATQSKFIAEASPYDRIYGIGLSKEQAVKIPPERWSGSNLLGKALMHVRAQLVSS
jgi:ribA/ribD-fused uncharacterized protein